jgi:hypothetical protein
MSQDTDKAAFLLAGRVVTAAAGLVMFALSLYWQVTFVPVPPDTTDAAWHPFFVAIAVLGLAIAAGSCGRRPSRLLIILPIAAPFGLYCLAGEGPVRWMGYGFLAAAVGTAIVYHGSKGLEPRHVVRDVM